MQPSRKLHLPGGDRVGVERVGESLVAWISPAGGLRCLAASGYGEGWGGWLTWPARRQPEAKPDEPRGSHAQSLRCAVGRGLARFSGACAIMVMTFRPLVQLLLQDLASESCRMSENQPVSVHAGGEQHPCPTHGQRSTTRGALPVAPIRSRRIRQRATTAKMPWGRVVSASVSWVLMSRVPPRHGRCGLRPEVLRGRRPRPRAHLPSGRRNRPEAPHRLVARAIRSNTTAVTRSAAGRSFSIAWSRGQS